VQACTACAVHLPCMDISALQHALGPNSPRRHAYCKPWQSLLLSTAAKAQDAPLLLPCETESCHPRPCLLLNCPALELT
jgi:hypothetical protein